MTMTSTSSALFDMLGIDAGDGIDTSEVDAIKRTLARIKAGAAEVAKHNTTTDTLAILNEMERIVLKMSSAESVEEVEQMAGGGSSAPAPKSTPPALNPGSDTTPTDPSAEETKKALGVVLASRHVDTGFKHLIRRGYDQAAPDRIEHDSKGTPKEVADLRAEVTKLTREFNNAQAAQTAAEQEVKDQADPKKAGSLAQQLKDAKAGKPSVDGVDKALVKQFVTDLNKGLNGIHAALGSGKQLQATKKVVDTFEEEHLK